MDRLLLLRLRSEGAGAEVRLNGLAVARTPLSGGEVCVPVHEYLVEGLNTITLVGAAPRPGQPMAPQLPAAPLWARARLLLPRQGQPGSEATARQLAALDWDHPAGEPLLTPAEVARQVDLPIRFPRWRWLDMPQIPDTAATQVTVAGFVQVLAMALARGDADAFVQASRLRFEELAVAYQQPVADLVARWRSRIQLLQATKALQVQLPMLADVRLLPCADGRLLECVAPDGEPVLRTAPAADGTRQAWPIRVAVIDGHCHVLR